MIGQESPDTERKIVAILKMLGDSPEPLGGRVIAHRLSDFGIDLAERTVRYHLKIMDGRGLTRKVGLRGGRSITERGIEELGGALVRDRVMSTSSRIELLAYRTSLDLDKRSGDVPINTALFAKKEFEKALSAMRDSFAAGFCVSDLVAVAFEGEMLGEIMVPARKIGLATISNVVYNGVLLKAGVHLDSRFGGVLQFRNNRPLRFVELIECSGCSLSPSEIFLASRMTNVREAASTGDGRILAHFRELPSPCRPVVEAILGKLHEMSIGGVIAVGKQNNVICEITETFDKIGLVLQSGLNPIAAAMEAGIEVTNRAMSGIIDYSRLKRFQDLAY